MLDAIGDQKRTGLGTNDCRVATNPTIVRGRPKIPLAYDNDNMPGTLSSVHLLP
jgi:hypothetical protein